MYPVLYHRVAYWALDHLEAARLKRIKEKIFLATCKMTSPIFRDDVMHQIRRNKFSWLTTSPCDLTNGLVVKRGEALLSVPEDEAVISFFGNLNFIRCAAPCAGSQFHPLERAPPDGRIDAKVNSWIKDISQRMWCMHGIRTELTALSKQILHFLESIASSNFRCKRCSWNECYYWLLNGGDERRRRGGVYLYRSDCFYCWFKLILQFR